MNKELGYLSADFTQSLIFFFTISNYDGLDFVSLPMGICGQWITHLDSERTKGDIKQF